MTEKNYVLNNIGTDDFIVLFLVSIVKGAIVTAPLIAALFIIGDPLRCVLFVGVSALVFAAISRIGSGKFIPTTIELPTLVGYCIPSYLAGAIVVMVIEYIIQVIECVIQLLWIVWSIVPYSIVPTIVFAWMLRGKEVKDWAWKSVTLGFGFGILLKLTGIVLVIMTDTIGLPLTAGAVAIESIVSLWWLHNDLQEWVRQDTESKKTNEEREEQIEFVREAKELAKRTRWM
jgi:hypothetical protein